MDELISALRQFTLEDAIIIEESDRQFLAIKSLFSKIENREYFLPLIITNSLLSYQLSSSGEDYWEEFCSKSGNHTFTNGFEYEAILRYFGEFLPNSRGNKRLLNMKIPRLQKTNDIWKDYLGKGKYYYENLAELQDLLAIKMKQKKDDKTILFALKMFHYGARLEFGEFKTAPFEIGMPIDSRLTKIEKIFNTENLDSQIFWQKITKEVRIPCLHLDAILWVRCNDFLCLNI